MVKESRSENIRWGRIAGEADYLNQITDNLALKATHYYPEWSKGKSLKLVNKCN